jgi:uncharacterized membrane protein (DUF2068 family)
VHSQRVLPAEARERTLGVRLIIAYKFSKAAAGLVLSVFLLFGGKTTFQIDLVYLASLLSDHAVHAWVRAVAHFVVLATRPAHLLVLGLVVGADALLSGAEGWFLYRGHRWAPWLVVGASGGFLPYELYLLVHAPDMWRLALLSLNAAVVAYLVAVTLRRAAQSRRLSRPDDRER